MKASKQDFTRLVFIEDGGITTVEMASVAFVLDMTVYESVDVK